MITTCIMIKEVHPVISYIRGPLEEKREDSVVVEAGNIGYRIFIPSSVLGELPGLGEMRMVMGVVNVEMRVEMVSKNLWIGPQEICQVIVLDRVGRKVPVL